MEQPGVVKAELGNVVEWEDKRGNILFGKVFNIRENVAIVDCTIMPNFHALGIEERQVASHKKYRIIDHTIDDTPHDVIISKMPSKPVQKEEPTGSGFSLGEVVKFKKMTEKAEQKKQEVPPKATINKSVAKETTKPTVNRDAATETPKPAVNRGAATKKDPLFIRFGHTKEEYLDLAKTNSDKEIRKLWDWDHNKINRFKHAHKLIESNRTSQSKPELTIKELNEKYGHTKEEYLKLKLKYTDNEIQELWNWDHNRIYRFKKAHKLIESNRTSQSKPELTVKELNEKYGHTKEEYLELKLKYTDNEIQELWNWDHNKIYRFKKAHKLTGFRGQPKLDTSKTIRKAIKNGKETSVEQSVEPVVDEVVGTVEPSIEVTATEQSIELVVDEGVETMEPSIEVTATEQSIEPVADEMIETAEPSVEETTTEQSVEPVTDEVVEKHTIFSEPTLMFEEDEPTKEMESPSIHLTEEENAASEDPLSITLLKRCEQQNAEISKLKRTIDQLQNNPYQNVVTAFVQLEASIQEAANHSVLANLLLTAITTKTPLNQPTKYE